MKKISILCHGKKSLFRNSDIIFKDVAGDNVSMSAIYGIIGNICGLWRKFNDINDKNNALVKWIETNKVGIANVKYEYDGVFSETKHVFKSVNYEAGNGLGEKDYHRNPVLTFDVIAEDQAIDEIIFRVKKPCSIAYFGQSDCPIAQIMIVG